MLINIKKTMTLLSTLLLSIMCSFCSDTIDVYAGQYGEEEGTNEPETPEVVGKIIPIEPLRNPDRGFHLECNLLADEMKSPYNEYEVYGEDLYTKKVEQFDAKDDNLTLVQQYIYLTKWVSKDLDDEALDNIRKVFELMKAQGYKAILRFAYNHAGLNTSGGESKQWILRHIEQLTPLLNEYIGQIATVQVGFIGAWGEWHTSPLVNDQDAKNAIVSALLRALPVPYCVEMRYPNHKKALTLEQEEYRGRIGYANDYFTAGEHSHAPGNDFVPNTDDYKQITEEVKANNFYMSGEIPYDEDTEWGLSALITPMKSLRILREHRYSAFDVTQNFALNIMSWKQVKVYPSLLNDNNILFDESYFKDAEGNDVVRSFYEFVRDHLGYRLNLQSESKVEAKDGNLEYDLTITNTGFATVINPKEVYLVLVSGDGQVVKEIKLDVEPKNWIPSTNEEPNKAAEYSIKGSMAAGLSGTYKVGIWMPEKVDDLKYNPVYAIKFALTEKLTHWYDDAGKYAVNIFGEVTF